MQVSIETTTGLERRLTIGVPAEKVDVEVDKRLKDASKNVRLNGFRKGKVPLKVVKQQYGQGVRQEVVGDVINTSFQDAVTKESVRPAGQPQIEITQFEEGKDLEYTATFEVYPEIALGEFSGYEITKLNADVVESDIDEMIQTLREQQASFAQVERAAADGDQVNIDFAGTKDGEAFEGGSSQGHDLVLGSNSMIPGFETGIEGMSAGETKVLALTFPEDYHAEDLKGAAVEFSITLNNVSEKQLPELDSEFMTKFGIEDGDMEKFRTNVKDNMVRELANASKNQVKSQVMDELLKTHEVELPQALITAEIEQLRTQMMQQFGGAENNPNLDLKSLLPDDMFKEQAERRVSLGLLISEVVKANEIKVDADSVRAMIENIASTYQDPEQVINYYYQNQELLAGAESAALEDQVVELILSQSTLVEKEANYKDVVKQEQPSA